jgi:hypothetical protein
LRSNEEEEKGRLKSSPFVGRDNLILYQKVFNKWKVSILHPSFIAGAFTGCLYNDAVG